MTQLGNGLHEAEHYEDALPVYEAELATMRRLGAQEDSILITQTNLAMTYGQLGRVEQALQIERDVYARRLKLQGEEHPHTLQAAINYASSLIYLRRSEEAKSLLRKWIPVARRVSGDGHESTLRLRFNYARAIVGDTSATLNDLRQAVTTLEDTGRIARRVFGDAHPLTMNIEGEVQKVRAALAARGDVESIREAVAAMTPGDA